MSEVFVSGKFALHVYTQRWVKENRVPHDCFGGLLFQPGIDPMEVLFPDFEGLRFFVQNCPPSSITIRGATGEDVASLGELLQADAENRQVH
ncbi:MAG TPA: hypothetical protein VJT81_00430 [Burkholderiales bacterium]|nr:hypothetical protein [Burkholderiales bacterium]